MTSEKDTYSAPAELIRWVRRTAKKTDRSKSSIVQEALRKLKASYERKGKR